MNKFSPTLAVLAVPGLALGVALAVGLALGFAPEAQAMRRVETVELDEASVIIEWNATDDEYALEYFWDGDPWKTMTVKNHKRKTVLNVRALRNVRRQGLTEGLFGTEDSDLEELLERYPEGEYTFKGRGIERERLVGEAEFTHTLAAAPTNLSPKKNDLVSVDGFTASFDPVTLDTEGNAVVIDFYELVVEKDDDEPILQTFKVILPPTRTSVFIPGEFLEPDTEYKLEVIAVEESGNRSITETGKFDTDG